MSTTHLMIIGDRDALSWVVTEQRMAFPAGRSKLSQTVNEGDEIFLYTTRKCFRNPTRDRGRLMGRATVSSPVHALPQPLRLAERDFSYGCSLKIDSLARWREGLELSDLVPQLRVFPDPATWSVRMRTAVLPLPAADAHLLRAAIAPLFHPYLEMVKEYSSQTRSL